MVLNCKNWYGMIQWNNPSSNQNWKVMSSNIQVERICLYCNSKFIARTTKTKYCSHRCNSRHYKQLAKEEKIAVLNIQFSAMGLLKTKVDWWIKEGIIQTQRIDKKHILKRTDIDVMLAKWSSYLQVFPKVFILNFVKYELATSSTDYTVIQS